MDRRPGWRLRAHVAVIGLGSAGCYFLTDFDSLRQADDGGTAPVGPATSTTSAGGAGGAPAGGDGGTGGGEGGDGGVAPCPRPGVNYAGLVLNELAPKGVPEDWMELRNNSEAPIPLCAVFITQGYDDMTPPGGGDRFTFGHVTIGAGQYLVLQEVVDFPFGLAKDEPERITLFAPDSTVLDDTAWAVGIPDQFIAGESWARIPDASGPFERSASPTKGDTNASIGQGGAGGGGGAGGSGG
jgi:hypothetical protein